MYLYTNAPMGIDYLRFEWCEPEYEETHTEGDEEETVSGAVLGQTTAAEGLEPSRMSSHKKTHSMATSVPESTGSRRSADRGPPDAAGESVPPETAGAEDNVQDPQPRARSLGSLFSFNENIYLFGGISGKYGITTKDFWEYDIDDRGWEFLGFGDAPHRDPSGARAKELTKRVPVGNPTLEPPRAITAPSFDPQGKTAVGAIPKARAGATTTNMRHEYSEEPEYVLLFGGSPLHGDRNHSDLWRITADGHGEISWNSLQVSGDPPRGRWNHIAVNYRGNLIIHGGEDRQYNLLGDTLLYNPETNVWNSFRSFRGQQPIPRMLHSAVCADHRLLIFGGIGQYELSDCWSLDPAAMTWTEMQLKTPTPFQEINENKSSLSGARAFMVDDKVVIYGGRTGYNMSPCIWVLDMEGNRWHRIPAMYNWPPSRWKYSACMDAHQRLWLYGGVTDGGDGRTGDLWRCDMVDMRGPKA